MHNLWSKTIPIIILGLQATCLAWWAPPSPLLSGPYLWFGWASIILPVVTPVLLVPLSWGLTPCLKSSEYVQVFLIAGLFTVDWNCPNSKYTTYAARGIIVELWDNAAIFAHNEVPLFGGSK